MDSYYTDNPKSDGMRARPVIGGVFIKMLEDPSIWKKWAGHDRLKLDDYAPAPIPPQGRWHIYGLGLPEQILRKVYWENAARLIGLAAG